MQKPECARRGNLGQVISIRQPHTKTLFADEGMGEVNRIGDRVSIRRINSNKFIAFPKLNLADDSKVGPRLTLFANTGLLDHFDKRLGASIKDRQLQVIQFNESIVDSHPYKCRQQMLGGGDEYALFHQARGVADSGYVAATG